jgi:hypothetical protein
MEPVQVDIRLLSPTMLRSLSGLTRREDVNAYVSEWLAFEDGCVEMDAPSVDCWESYQRFESARRESGS